MPRSIARDVPGLVFVGLVFAAAAMGQDRKPIETDRPDVTPYTVPAGSLQVENGIAVTGDEAGHTLDLTESLVRIGVGSTTEVRLGAPDYFYRLRRPDTPASGFIDYTIGIKQRLGSVAGLDLAAVPTVPEGAGLDVQSSSNRQWGQAM